MWSSDRPGETAPARRPATARRRRAGLPGAALAPGASCRAALSADPDSAAARPAAAPTGPGPDAAPAASRPADPGPDAAPAASRPAGADADRAPPAAGPAPCAARRRRAGLPGAALALVLLAACGFEPLYDPAGPAAGAAGRVDIGVIDGQPGFAMRDRLVARLGLAQGATHRLDVDLSFDKSGVAITEKDVTSRFDITGTADWKLTPLAGDRPVLSGTETAVTGYSAPTSETSSAFAILSAQRSAEERLAETLADRIAQRVAVASDDWAGK